jgi:hypothetical protein
MEVNRSLINNYITWEWQISVIMVCFVFSLDNRKEWTLSFLSLQIFNIAVVLPSEIQLSIWDPVDLLTPPHACTCPIPCSQFPSCSLCSVSEDERLILVELLTFTAYTFFSLLHGRHICF